MHYRLITFFEKRIRRAYCKWALAKKKKSLNELTPFEKKLIMVLKRVCLLPDSEFNYGFTESVGRIVTNEESGVTIQIKGNEVRFIDSDMITVFFATPEVSSYLTSIFDRSTELRAKRREDEILSLQLNHLRQVELTLMETPKKRPRPIKLKQKTRPTRPRETALSEEEILQIAVGG